MQSVNKKKGALPSQTIFQMVEAGSIVGAEEKNIRPASLDLSVSEEIYAVEGVFQPKPGETVRQVLAQIKKTPHELGKPLLRNQMYIARLREKLDLPETVYAYCNPKSTSGRIDTHIRLIADSVSRYDAITAGWQGELWISIMPKSFSIKLYEGISLNQLRFFNDDTRLNELELELEMKKSSLLWKQYDGSPINYRDFKIRDNDGSLILSLDLSNEVLGYKGIKSDKVIDLQYVNHYEHEDFFTPIYKNGEFVYLKQNEFYILSTLESVKVPPYLACEMVPMDERSGEFRSHYAGFIDPGWGWKNGDGKGRPLTLEVRPFEDIIVRHGQPIGKIKFEKVSELPISHYDDMGSNYVSQSGPRLAKHFK